jgi:tetratricopeptide (TPR) repeat protein
MATIEISIKDLHNQQHRALANNDAHAMRDIANKLKLVLEHDPDQWQAVFMLANCYQYLSEYVLAILLLHAARHQAPDASEIYNNLGTAYRYLGLQDRARQCYEHSLKLRPEQADVFQNIGTLYINEGCPEEAEQWLRRAMPMDPSQPHTHWNLGLALLEQEQWAEGFREYAWGIATGDRMGKKYNGTPWWTGDSVDTLVVYGEQGIGDELMYASLIPTIARRGLAKRIILDCHPRLEIIFTDAFLATGIASEIHPTRKELDESRTEWLQNGRRFDAKCSLGNLPKHLIKTEKDFPRQPYIDTRCSRYIMEGGKLDVIHDQIKALGYDPAAPLVAISWVGGSKKTNKLYRSIPLDALCDAILHRIPNAQFLSIQYTGHEEDIKKSKHQVFTLPHIFESRRWEKYYPMVNGRFLMQDDGQTKLWVGDKYEAKAISKQHGGSEEYYFEKPDSGWDYSDFVAGLAAIHELGGAIVTINNSTVHTCGAMGLPCFTLTPSKPAWRYGLKRNDMVWYPKDSVRQFRQKGTDWGPALRRMAKKVEVYLHANQPRIHGAAESAAR